MILTVTPNPCLDRTRFADGREEWQSGGKGLNIARVLTNLGQSAVALTTAGGERGERLKGLMADEGIAFEAIPVEAATRTVTTELDAEGRQTVYVEPGLFPSPAEGLRFLDAFDALLPGADFVVLGGGMPGGKRRAKQPSDELYSLLIRRARLRGVPVWLDANGPGLRSWVEAGPDYWKPNEEELRSVLPEDRDADVLDIAARLLKHVGNIVLSMGEKGACLLRREHAPRVQPPFTVNVVNAVGSGDSFGAAFIDALLRGAAPEEALRRASAAGAANAAMFPAARVTKEDIERILRGKGAIV